MVILGSSDDEIADVDGDEDVDEDEVEDDEWWPIWWCNPKYFEIALFKETWKKVLNEMKMKSRKMTNLMIEEWRRRRYVEWVEVSSKQEASEYPSESFFSS